MPREHSDPQVASAEAEEAEARRDHLLARVGELHALADDLHRADDGEFGRTLSRIEDVVQQLREL